MRLIGSNANNVFPAVGQRYNKTKSFISYVRTAQEKRKTQTGADHGGICLSNQVVPDRRESCSSTDVRVAALEPQSSSGSLDIISLIITIICLVIPVTWLVKTILLVFLWWLITTFVWRRSWKKPSKAMVSVAFLVLLIGISLKPLHHEYLDETRLPQSTLSISAFATNLSYKEGETLGGVKWENKFQDVRLLVENTAEQPALNLVLTVEVLPDSGDTIAATEQLSNVPEVQIQFPQVPDMHIQLKGADGGTAVYSTRDEIDKLGAKGSSFHSGDQCTFLCSRLPSAVPLRMVIATVPKMPNKLRVIGTYEKMPSEGSKIVRIDKIIDVSRL